MQITLMAEQLLLQRTDSSSCVDKEGSAESSGASKVFFVISSVMVDYSPFLKLQSSHMLLELDTQQDRGLANLDHYVVSQILTVAWNENMG